LELSDLYISPNIFREIKSRRMNWVRHVARMREGRHLYRIWWGILRERDHLEVPYLDESIIFE